MMIRVAEQTDLNSIVSIHLSSSRFGYKDFVTAQTLSSLSKPLYVEAWKKHLASESQSTYVACEDDLPIGVGSVLQAEGGESELTHLFVSPDYVGQGIGQRILEEARSIVKGGMYLWVFKDNQRARRFYESNGFQLAGESRSLNYHGEQHIQVSYSIGHIT